MGECPWSRPEQGKLLYPGAHCNGRFRGSSRGRAHFGGRSEAVPGWSLAARYESGTTLPRQKLAGVGAVQLSTGIDTGGGTGRHAILRGWCRKASRFEWNDDSVDIGRRVARLGCIHRPRFGSVRSWASRRLAGRVGPIREPCLQQPGCHCSWRSNRRVFRRPTTPLRLNAPWNNALWLLRRPFRRRGTAIGWGCRLGHGPHRFRHGTIGHGLCNIRPSSERHSFSTSWELCRRGNRPHGLLCTILLGLQRATVGSSCSR